MAAKLEWPSPLYSENNINNKNNLISVFEQCEIKHK